MFTVAIDSEGKTFAYFIPNNRGKVTFRPIVSELSCLYTNSELRAEFLMMEVPFSLSREMFKDCTPALDVISKYNFYVSETSTMVCSRAFSGDGNIVFSPCSDFEVAMGEALRRLLNPSQYHGIMPRRFQHKLPNIHSSVLAGKVPWCTVVHDVTGSNPYGFMILISRLHSALSLDQKSPRSVESLTARILSLESRTSETSIKPRMPPPLPSDRAQFFGVAYMDSSASPKFGVGYGNTSDYPFGIAPPCKNSDIIGRSFSRSGMSWTITHAYEPVVPETGWLYEVESEDGTISGMNQYMVEMEFFQSGHGYVSWLRPPRLRSTLMASHGVSESRPMSWSRFHKSRYFDRVSSEYSLGDEFVLNEFHRGDFWIVKYKKTDAGFDVVRRMRKSDWERSKKMKALKSKSEDVSINKLKSLKSSMNPNVQVVASNRGPRPEEVKSKLKMLKDNTENQKSLLSKLKRIKSSS